MGWPGSSVDSSLRFTRTSSSDGGRAHSLSRKCCSGSRSLVMNWHMSGEIKHLCCEDVEVESSLFDVTLTEVCQLVVLCTARDGLSKSVLKQLR